MSSVADALAEKGIHADRDGLHLLPPEQLQQSVALQEECKEFLSKTKQFNEIVADFITVMEGKSKVRHTLSLPAAGPAGAPAPQAASGAEEAPGSLGTPSARRRCNQGLG